MPRAKKDTTLAVAPPSNELPVELLKIAESSGMQITEAQAIGLSFAPFMQRVNELSIAIQDIPVDDPTPEHAATARKLRLELVANRGKNGVLNTHKELKQSTLIKANLIDNYKNIIEDSSKMSEVIAEGIEKHSERKEAVRLDAVEQERLTALLPYGTNTEFVNIRLMDDSTFTRFLANEKLLFEAQELERVKADEARLQAEKEAENERKRIEADRVEEQRKRDAELKRMQEAEAARIAQEKRDKEARDKLYFARLKELKPFNDNADLMALDGMSAVDFKALVADSKDKHAQRIQAQKEQAKKDEAARLEREKLQATQAAREKELQALKDKQAAELKAAQEKEAARIKAEQDAAKAPDRDKMRVWFEKFKALQDDLPDFKSKEGAAISVLIKTGMTNLRTLIITEAASLK